VSQLLLIPESRRTFCLVPEEDDIMRHFYRSYRSFKTFPCGWKRYAFAGYTAPRDEPAAQQQANFHESRHRHGHRGGSFGARRPLRYLSYRLDLDERQQRALAAILERLKIDREQARLDEQKTVSEVATMVTGDTISVDGFQQALAPRVNSARNLQTAIAKAMQELTDLLDADQREELAHLLRSGAFRI
jgi:hypothetical protein